MDAKFRLIDASDPQGNNVSFIRYENDCFVNNEIILICHIFDLQILKLINVKLIVYPSKAILEY